MNETKRYSQLAILLVVILGYAHITIGETIVKGMTVLTYGIIAFCLLAMLVWSMRIVRDGLIQWKISGTQITRAQAEAKNAEIVIIKADRNEQLVIHDPNPKSYYRQMHLSPTSHVNGKSQTPTDQQLQVYNKFYETRPTNKQPYPQPDQVLIEDGGTGDILSRYSKAWVVGTLLQAFHLHICGATGSGKTTLANSYLSHRINANPATKVYLINPKDHPGSQPFVVDPVCKSIDDVMDWLTYFNKIMISRQQGKAPIDPPIIFMIDEWDWVFDTYGPEAVRLARALIKVGRELGISVLLIGQSPLSTDTGLNGSVFDNMVRIGIMTAGEKLINALPMDKNEARPYRAEMSNLRQLNTTKPPNSQDLVRYCLVTVMGGNPTVEVIPTITGQPTERHPAPADKPQRSPTSKTTNTPNPDELEIFRAWFDLPKQKRSWNKLWQITTNKTTTVSKAKIVSYKQLFDKYNVSY